MKYVIECIREERNDMKQRCLNRHMIGPFVSFNDAHIYMETILTKKFDTIVIHNLLDLYDPEEIEKLLKKEK
jgi:hypothetical protein